jgi:hypothetical protein
MIRASIEFVLVFAAAIVAGVMFFFMCGGPDE